MKFFLIACVLAVVTPGSFGRTILPQDKLFGFLHDENIQQPLIRMVSLGLLSGYQRHVLSNPVKTESDTETQATLSPPLPDPLELPDLELFFPSDSLLKDILVGSVEYTDVVVTGTSTLVHDLSIVLLPTKLTFTLNAANITLKGVHDTDLSVLSGQYNLTGQDNFELNVDDLATKVEVSVLVNHLADRVSITKLDVTLDYEDLSINFGVIELNGASLDWDYITLYINTAFDLLWNSLNAVLTELVMNDLNELIKDCKLSDLMNGNFECLAPQVPGLTTTEAPVPETTTAEPEVTFQPTTVEIPEPTTLKPVDPECPKPPVTINLNVIFNFNFNFK